MEKPPVTFRCHRAVAGALMAGALTLPLLTAAVAAPPKPGAKPAAAPAGAPKGDAKKGKDAFKSEGCAGCHKSKDFQDPNASAGPDLSMEGKDHTAAQIQKSVEHPKSGSIMPAFKGPKPTLANLVAYLMSQK